MSGPSVGQYLHASCSDVDFGPILRVGKDDGDHDVIDLQVDDINEFIYCDRWEEDGGSSSLMRVEPKGPVIFRDLQYRMRGYTIECNTPGDGCGRCTSSFMIFDRPRQNYETVARDGETGFKAWSRIEAKISEMTK